MLKKVNNENNSAIYDCFISNIPAVELSYDKNN